MVNHFGSMVNINFNGHGMVSIKQHGKLIMNENLFILGEFLQDIRLPEKLRGVRSTEIGLAANIDITNGKTFVPVSNNDSVLFAYMPTKISTYNLPLLVNANFLTNANREQIRFGINGSLNVYPV